MLDKLSVFVCDARIVSQYIDLGKELVTWDDSLNRFADLYSFHVSSITSKINLNAAQVYF